jgi:hypothetical protein
VFIGFLLTAIFCLRFPSVAFYKKIYIYGDVIGHPGEIISELVVLIIVIYTNGADVDQ